MGEVLSQKYYNWRVFYYWHPPDFLYSIRGICTDIWKSSLGTNRYKEHTRLGISKEDGEGRIPEDVYQFTLLFFVPDVVYLFICSLLFYVRGCLSVHCPLKLNFWWCVPIHVPTTAVFHRESACPFFYHFCMLQVVYLFTCLTLPNIRECLPFRLPSTVRQIMLTFPFAICWVSGVVYLSICPPTTVYVRGCVANVHCPLLLRMSAFPFVLHCFTIKEDVYLQIRFHCLISELSLHVIFSSTSV